MFDFLGKSIITYSNKKIKFIKKVEIIHKIVYNKYEAVILPMTSKEMIKFLLKNGFIEIPGGKGSHRRFYNQSTGKITQVPCHSKELKKGMEQAILKQAGLK